MVAVGPFQGDRHWRLSRTPQGPVKEGAIFSGGATMGREGAGDSPILEFIDKGDSLQDAPDGGQGQRNPAIENPVQPLPDRGCFAGTRCIHPLRRSRDHRSERADQRNAPPGSSERLHPDPQSGRQRLDRGAALHERPGVGKVARSRGPCDDLAATAHHLRDGFDGESHPGLAELSAFRMAPALAANVAAAAVSGQRR